MKVLFEVGNKKVELEDNKSTYLTSDEKDMFLDLIEDAMNAIGYSVSDFLGDKDGV